MILRDLSIELNTKKYNIIIIELKRGSKKETKININQQDYKHYLKNKLKAIGLIVNPNKSQVGFQNKKKWLNIIIRNNTQENRKLNSKLNRKSNGK